MKRKTVKNKGSFVWECICGHIERSDNVPEDCPKCFRVGKFSPVPDDLIEEKEEEEVLSMKSGGFEDED